MSLPATPTLLLLLLLRLLPRRKMLGNQPSKPLACPAAGAALLTGNQSAVGCFCC
jgi:hypothetical protein